MKPPLPEVPPLPAPQEAKPILPGLTTLFWWNIASLVLSFVFEPRDPKISALEHAIWNGVGVIVVVPLAYFMWRGANWARLTMLYLTALFSPFYFLPADVLGDMALKSPPLLRLFDTALLVFTFVYLNLSAVKAHFKTPKTVK